MYMHLSGLVLLILAATSKGVFAGGIENPPASPARNEIMARFDTRTGGWPDPPTVVMLIKQRDPALLEVLGSPIDARLLVQLRIIPDLLALMPTEDPRVRLHQVVVLTFESLVAADVAEQLLRAEPTVVDLERSHEPALYQQLYEH